LLIAKIPGNAKAVGRKSYKLVSFAYPSLKVPVSKVALQIPITTTAPFIFNRDKD
jgi:hypothetical protein